METVTAPDHPTDAVLREFPQCHRDQLGHKTPPGEQQLSTTPCVQCGAEHDLDASPCHKSTLVGRTLRDGIRVRERVGDSPLGELYSAEYASGVEVVPAGAVVEGRVASVNPARTRGREGQIGLQFDAVVLPDGTRVGLDGSLTELQDSRAGTVDSENEVSGNSSEKRNIGYIGGGTVGGAVLGGAIGGGKGAGIGAIIGAGAGVAGVMLQKGNEVELRSGTEIGMTTTQPITFNIRSVR